ncbi:MAG: hypothetical protein JNL98_33545 [Bryobacterales bacterium]|nr:hypothetical protein [Bryobacterales bacterium]
MHRLVLGLAISLSLFAQTRDQRWQEDIRFAQSEILRIHPNPFTKVTRDTFNQAFTELLNNVASKSDFEVQAELARIVASIGDGHTSAPIPAIQTRLLPIRLRWFPDGLFVTAASEPQIRLLGKQVVSIGGKSAEEAYAAVKPYIANEFDLWARLLSGSQNYMVSPDLLRLAGVSSDASRVSIAVRETDGSTFEATLEPVQVALVTAPYLSRPLAPLYRRSPQQAYWYEYLGDSRTLYVKYNQCRNVPALPMSKFSDDVLATATSNPVDRVVFDLRNNGGGDSSVIAILLNKLAEAFMRGTINPSKGAFVIVGRETFSSGVNNTVDLKQNGVVVVGEPTGQGGSHFGQVVQIVLPNSRITLSTSTRLFSLPGYEIGTILPDIAVDLTSTDFFADRDPVLEAVLAR